MLLWDAHMCSQTAGSKDAKMHLIQSLLFPIALYDINNPILTFKQANGMNKTQLSENNGIYRYIDIYAHATYIKMPI